ncbi:MAG: hypothetical protein OZSIB_2250 [Candidatus Ozemobacter sibiricus]|jgi:hypothetical protein|uniref:Uncharacterized protein n=1 Tax=Candidatus Ozemobacter sibiricus TaxID=2268124 RepID=A0A367ZVM6_9BACT|nr:MAG: hypothetical protein OZSIB_2250 [Candidatus Ozemobacter sibiricus]
MTTTTVQPVGTLYAPTPSTTSSSATTTAASAPAAAAATTTGSTTAPATVGNGGAAPSGSGFEATLQNKVQVAFRLTRTIAGIQRPVLDAAASPASPAGGAPPAGAVLKVDQPCRACRSPASLDAAPGQYGWQFSFFARVAGDLGEWGRPMQAAFYETGRAVADTFARQVGWSGDPVGAFLQGTQQIMPQGPAATGSFFDSLRRRAAQGLESLSSSLLAVQSGIGLPSLNGNPAQTSPLPATGALDLARLHISSVANGASPSAPTRPRPHNRAGIEITMVSGPLRADRSARAFQDPLLPPARLELTGDQSPPPAAALDFLKKFLDLVRAFLDDLGGSAAAASASGSASSSSASSSSSSSRSPSAPGTAATDAASPAVPATEGDPPFPSPAENPPAAGDAPDDHAALGDPDAPTTVI